MPILRLVAPGARLIEIVVARHVAGNILSGSRPVFFLVALLSPLVEPVRTGPVKDAVGGVFCPVKFCLLAGMHFVGCSFGADFSYAANHGDARRVARFVYIDAKSSGFLNVEHHIRSIDFVDITLPQFPNAEIRGALRNANLGDACVEVQERKRRHATKMKSCFTGLQFGAGVFVHPKFVTDGHGAVTSRLSPIAFPAGLQRNGSFYDADPCDASGWVLVFIGARLRWDQKQKTGNTKQKPQFASAAPCYRLHDESPVLGRDMQLARDLARNGPSDGSLTLLASSRLNPRPGKKLPGSRCTGTSDLERGLIMRRICRSTRYTRACRQTECTASFPYLIETTALIGRPGHLQILPGRDVRNARPLSRGRETRPASSRQCRSSRPPWSWCQPLAPAPRPPCCDHSLPRGVGRPPSCRE